MKLTDLIGRTVTDAVKEDDGSIVIELDREDEFVVGIDLSPTEGPECPALTHKIRKTTEDVPF